MIHRVRVEKPEEKFFTGFRMVWILFVTVGFLISSAYSYDINTTFLGNKAAEGYDVVAYFTESKAVEGKEKFTYEYKGANWLFSSQKNMDTFKASPEKYEPQYGGYCGWAIAVKEVKRNGQGELWVIVDGKLYLNYSRSIKAKWEKYRSFFIRHADKIWPKMRDNK